MKLALILLMALTATAAPVLDPDGIVVDPSDQRIGRHVYSVPNSIWTVWGEDMPWPRWDHDHNDGVADIRFNNDGSGTATWLGSNSAWVNYWIIAGGTVSAASPSTSWGPMGVERLPIMFVSQDGGRYRTGSHNILTQQVPEPSTLLMLAFGLALVAIKGRRR